VPEIDQAKSQSLVEDIPSDTHSCPPLWNPNAAASWSLIFSPAFGSIIQMKNWQALGQPDRAVSSQRWFKISSAFLVFLLVSGLILPDSKAVDGLSRLAGLILLLSWYYANGKAQNAYVLARYGKKYPRKGWGKPLGLALACLLGFIVVAVVIGFTIGALTGVA
jgi:hypothetical protein